MGQIYGLISSFFSNRWLWVALDGRSSQEHPVNAVVLSKLLHFSVFSVWKSLQVLQKACIKIVACAVYTYLFFSYTCPLLFRRKKKKGCCDHCFLQRIRPITTVQLCILQDYSSVRIYWFQYELQTPHFAYSIHHLV